MFLMLHKNTLVCSHIFKNNESSFLSTDSRATQRRKGKKRKGRFSHKQEHEDPGNPSRNR